MTRYGVGLHIVGEIIELCHGVSNEPPMNLVTDDHYMDLYGRCQLMNNTFHLAGMWIIYTATMKVFLESSVVCGLVHAVYCV